MNYTLLAKHLSLNQCNRLYFNSVLIDFTEMLIRVTIVTLGDENIKNRVSVCKESNCTWMN